MPVIDELLNRSLWINVANATLYIIKQRTLDGVFLPGSTGTSEYSTTPAPIGFDQVNKVGRGKIERLIRANEHLPEKEREARYIKTKGGSILILLKDGYKGLRELAGKPTDHVNLTWTGAMLRDYKVKEVMPGGLPGYVLGNTDKDQALKTYWHNVAGAGKSKKTHKFVGLTKDELKVVADHVQNELTKR